jgi:hypothetical protein
MPQWLLSHEILQVRLRAQNDTLTGMTALGASAGGRDEPGPLLCRSARSKSRRLSR